MAYVSREIEASAHDVFTVIANPYTYPHWLAGAASMRKVDDDWPAVGSRFHHRVGFGPLTIPDSSKVLAIEPDRMLRLAVRARPLISAVATFLLVGDDRRCVVSIEEEPTAGLIGNLVRPVLDPLTHVRNQHSLKRLDDFVLARDPQADELDPEGRQATPAG